MAKNYEEFTGKVVDGIVNGLNNTEYGKTFTEKLLEQQLSKNPDMTVEEWHDIQTRVVTDVSSMKTKNYYTVILRSDSDEESFEDSSLRSE